MGALPLMPRLSAGISRMASARRPMSTFLTILSRTARSASVSSAQRREDAPASGPCCRPKRPAATVCHPERSRGVSPPATARMAVPGLSLMLFRPACGPFPRRGIDPAFEAGDRRGPSPSILSLPLSGPPPRAGEGEGSGERGAVAFLPPGVQPPAYTPSGPTPPRRALGKPTAPHCPQLSPLLESACVIDLDAQSLSF